MGKGKIYDMHCHASQLNREEMEGIIKENITIVGVSEDIESLRKTIEISHLYQGNIIVCAGLHPWKVKDGYTSQAEYIIKEVEKRDLRCIGEVGLDKRFLQSNTYEKQREVFMKFVRLAKDLDILINIHSPNAWNEVLNMLIENDVKRAMFHWYTGPVSLMEKIAENNYAISLNVALMLNKKHVDIVKASPKEHIVFESDAPYVYHGVRLSPLMIRSFVPFISKVKGIPENEIVELSLKKSSFLLKSN